MVHANRNNEYVNALYVMQLGFLNFVISSSSSRVCLSVEKNRKQRISCEDRLHINATTKLNIFSSIFLLSISLHTNEK